MNIRNELINSGRLKPQHVLLQSGWVSYWFHNNPEDIQAVIELITFRYEQIKPKGQIKSDLALIGKKY